MQLLVQLLPQDLALLLRAGLLGEELLALRRCLALQLLALCRGLGLQLLPLLLAHADATLDHLRLARRHGHRHLLPVHGDGGGARPLAPRLQLGAQAFDLLLELAQHGILGVLVDLGLVLDPLGAVRVPQRGQRLVVVVPGRPAVGDHHRLGVAAQAVLQQPRELGVAVRDVGRLGVDQGRDDVAQRREGEVDLRGFLETNARGARLGLPLGARQVDHVELAHADVLLAVQPLALVLHRHREDGVAAGALRVHGRCPSHAVSLPGLQNCVHLGRRLDHHARQVLHVDAAVHALLELQPRRDVLPEQVPDVLVVDLHVRRADQVLALRAARGVDALEDVLERVGHEAAQLRHVGHALHRVGLARAGLAVREDCAVVPVDDRVHDGGGGPVVNVLLQGVRPVRVVEGEELGRLAGGGLGVVERDLHASRVHPGADLASVGDLGLAQRADAHDHAHGLALLGRELGSHLFCRDDGRDSVPRRGSCRHLHAAGRGELGPA
mmetsp:Transcript_17033/g.64473  ORF Transcript_17033/g.64473 Transcript_17033/m.64473 type:complete len:496 (-) Transcript_17033:7-1494(-)